jgi:hypothetical protein
VWLDLIDHVRRRHDPALKAELANGMLRQLELAQPAAALDRETPNGFHKWVWA